MGGSSKSKTEIPKWLEGAARSNIATAKDISKIGYVPYYGPDVAALDPMQTAAMQNTANAASAFGLGAPADAMAGMPQAQTFAGGVQGYSSAPMYQQSLDTLKQNAPGQYKAIMDMFIDPITGADPNGRRGNGGGNANPLSDPFMSMFMGMGGMGMNSGGSGGGGGWPTGAPGGIRSTSSMNTPMSYMPGGVNTRNPASRVNQAAAALTANRNTVSAGSRPMANPRRS